MPPTKKPTAKDLEILSLLQSGKAYSSIEIQKYAGTIDHRDSVLRLRKSGYPIASYRVNYKNIEGKARWYMRYHLVA